MACLCDIALCHLKLGDALKASEASEQALKIDESHATALLRRGQARAIRSIPSYIRQASVFWICTPHGAVHSRKRIKR